MSDLPVRSGLPLVVCAPSGAGKSTLTSMLCREFGLELSVSCTTRQPRLQEVNGREYHFVSRQDFIERCQADLFAEWAMVHDHYYGTPLEPVRRALGLGRDLIFDIDVQGAAQLRLSLPDACFAFILPPSWQELEKRLRSRGTDDEHCIATRLANARREVAACHWFDALIVNDDLNTAYQDLRAFYLASRLKPRLNPGLAGMFMRNA